LIFSKITTLREEIPLSMKMTEHKSSDTINIKELRIEKLSENNIKFTEVFDCGD